MCAIRNQGTWGTWGRVRNLGGTWGTGSFLRLAVNLSLEFLVGAVGIELKAVLKMRKLLIPLNAKNSKNSKFAQVRYTAGTRQTAHMSGLA